MGENSLDIAVPGDVLSPYGDAAEAIDSFLKDRLDMGEHEVITSVDLRFDAEEEATIVTNVETAYIESYDTP